MKRSTGLVGTPRSGGNAVKYRRAAARRRRHGWTKRGIPGNRSWFRVE